MADAGGLIVGSLISAIASTVTAAMSSHSASALNRKSYHYTKALQEQQQQFNAEQAEIAYQRQIDMYDRQLDDSNHQYQRTVADLRAAGINPLLAVGGMSGYTPSFSSAPSATSAMGGVSTQSPDFSGISSAGKAIGDMIKDVSLEESSSNVANTKASTLKDISTAKNLESETELNKARILKTMKETESIDPDIEKDNKKYSGSVGSLAKSTKYAFNDFVEGLKSLFSPSSAKSVQKTEDLSNEILETSKPSNTTQSTGSTGRRSRPHRSRSKKHTVRDLNNHMGDMLWRTGR